MAPHRSIVLSVVRCDHTRCKRMWRCWTCNRRVCEHRCIVRQRTGVVTCGRCALAATQKASQS